VLTRGGSVWAIHPCYSIFSHYCVAYFWSFSNTTSSLKPEVFNIIIAMPPQEDRGNMHKKFGEDRTCSSRDMRADRQTDRHSHHNTPLQYRGQSKNPTTLQRRFDRSTRSTRYTTTAEFRKRWRRSIVHAGPQGRRSKKQKRRGFRRKVDRNGVPDTSWPHHALCLSALALWCRHATTDRVSSGIMRVSWRKMKRPTRAHTIQPRENKYCCVAAESPDVLFLYF